MQVTESIVLDALSKLKDPNTGQDWVTSKSIKNVQILGAHVSLGLSSQKPVAPIPGLDHPSPHRS